MLLEYVQHKNSRNKCIARVVEYKTDRCNVFFLLLMKKTSQVFYNYCYEFDSIQFNFKSISLNEKLSLLFRLCIIDLNTIERTTIRMFLHV